MRDRSARHMTDAEATLWREVIKTVTPISRPPRLKQPDVTTSTPANETAHTFSSDVPIRRHAAAKPFNGASVSDAGSVSRTNADAPLVVDAPQGTDRRTAQRLKRGRLAIDARLDLHGYSLTAAHTRLLEFLRSAQAHGGRCVLIVTGKGRRAVGDRERGQPGKLKSAVPEWLNEPLFRPLVLSVTHAQPKDGGTGALYVLLRKARGHGAGPDGEQRG